MGVIKPVVDQWLSREDLEELKRAIMDTPMKATTSTLPPSMKPEDLKTYRQVQEDGLRAAIEALDRRGRMTPENEAARIRIQRKLRKDYPNGD